MTFKEGVSNIFINDFLLTNSANYYGTYSSDDIPVNEFKSRDTFSIVCNLSKRKSPGTHFIVIISRIIQGRRRLIYIDPLGLPCINTHILKFLHGLHHAFEFNTTQIQDVESVFCGMYCILYVMWFVEMKLELQFYKNNLIRNDKLCTAYIKMLKK